MIQQMLAIWSLVHLPFLKPAWTSGSSQFTYWGRPVVKSISTAFVNNCFVLYYVRGIIHHDLMMINFINLGSYAKRLMSNVKLTLDTCVERPYCFNTSYTPGAFLGPAGMISFISFHGEGIYSKVLMLWKGIISILFPCTCPLPCPPGGLPKTLHGR